MKRKRPPVQSPEIKRDRRTPEEKLRALESFTGRTRAEKQSPKSKAIDRRHREFWETENKRCRNFFEKNRKHLLTAARKMQREALRYSDLGMAAFIRLPDLEQYVKDEIGDESKKQSEKAKRPRKGNQLKELVIEAMRAARMEGQSFRAFLDAAGTRSFDDYRLTISEEEEGTFEIKYDPPAGSDGKLTDTETKSLKTLENWWGESKPQE